MVDLDLLLVHPVEALVPQTADSRRVVYERARVTVRRGVGLAAGMAEDAECEARCEALECAIARVEARYADGREVLAGGGTVDSLEAVSEPPMPDERRRFAFNAAASGAASLIKITVQLVLLPVLARLLGPAEFGLYALAVPTVLLLATLADGGLGASLAREAESSTAVWSTAFWALVGSCSLLAMLTVAGGFVLAGLSGQPRLPGLVALLSLSFPLLALAVLPAARLTRRGNLVVHAVADTVATLAGAGVAVALALCGAGAWALAAQYVFGWIVSCAILNAAAFERPTLTFRPQVLKTHAATGGVLIAGRLSDLFGRQAENLLFGHLFGAAALGSYTFANQATRFVCEAAGNPLWGALYAHALRAEAREMERLHATLSRLLASALFPASALLAAAAPEVFDALLGPRWAVAAVLVQIIVPFYALNTVAAQCGAILLAKGHNRAMLCSLTGLNAGRILALVVGSSAGPEGIAWGIDVVNAAYAAAMFSAVGIATGTSAWSSMRAMLPPLVASGAGAAVCHVLIVSRPETLLWTIVCLASGGAAFILGIMLLSGRRLMADIFAIRRLILARA